MPFATLSFIKWCTWTSWDNIHIKVIFSLISIIQTLSLLLKINFTTIIQEKKMSPATQNYFEQIYWFQFLLNWSFIHFNKLTTLFNITKWNWTEDNWSFYCVLFWQQMCIFHQNKSVQSNIFTVYKSFPCDSSVTNVFICRNNFRLMSFIQKEEMKVFYCLKKCWVYLHYPDIHWHHFNCTTRVSFQHKFSL